jgi:hypothetical protein
MTAAWEKAESLEQAGQEKLRADAAKTRLHLRGVGHLPLDHDQARVELTEEQRAHRASRPRNRRWRALEKLDVQIDRLNQRQTVAAAQLQEAEQRLARAPQDDARALADWLAGGERGGRPEATLYERQRERDAAQLLVEAIAVKLDEALQRRLDHVNRNRKKMLADAHKDVDESQRRLLEKIAELPALRDELIAARETLVWLGYYPDPVESWGISSAVALGLREPVEKTLGTRARIEYEWLCRVLEKDVSALASAFSRDQKRRLGVAQPRTPVREAMWDSDPDNVAWKKAELERARRLAEWHDPALVAAEIRDQRP